MRRSTSQRIVNFLLPAAIAYGWLYAIWSIIRPWVGY